MDNNNGLSAVYVHEKKGVLPEASILPLHISVMTPESIVASDNAK